MSLNTELIEFASDDDLTRTAAEFFCEQLRSAPADRPLSIALSGGRISQKLFRAISDEHQRQPISLAPVHVFWADERCVPPDSPDSNYGAARDHFLRPFRIPDSQVHRIKGELGPEDAALEADRDLKTFLQAQLSQSIDLVLLGMGEDGHVASLFPQHPPQVEIDRHWYKPVRNSPKPPPDRVSLTYSAILEAQNVWVLISGTGKEAALSHSLASDGNTPLAYILRKRKHTKVFTDIPASQS